MLDFEAEDELEPILAVKKDRIITGPDMVATILAPPPGAVLFILCAALTVLTLASC